jgi:sulfate permease, SulP family
MAGRSSPTATLKPGTLDLRQIAVSIGAGVVAALMNFGMILSIAALIFAGSLAPYVSNGVSLMLISAAIMSIVFAVASSRPGMVIFAQDGPALLLALIAAAIIAGFPADQGAAAYLTVIATIALTTLASGITFFLLGQFRLGSLVRYLPYPVVGGFLAGTGWLLVLGGIGIMAGVQPSLAQLPALFLPPTLWRWLPGLVFGLGILFVLQRIRHPLALPGMFALGVAAFYAWLTAVGGSIEAAQANGLLLGPFPNQLVWAPLTPAMLADVNWPLIITQSAPIGTAVAIGVIGLLLNVSGLQLARREDLDLNQELRAAGLAQLASGMFGGLPGYHALGASTLAHRMGARSRLVSITFSVVLIAFFFFGGTFIALVPQVVLGSLVCYLGLAFLHDWLVETWGRLPRIDYALVVFILLLIAVFGMLTGVIVGLFIAVALFVVTYSRIEVVKHALTGATVQSRVTRSYTEQERLRELGAQTVIFQLQGFIFFGTAHELFERVRRRVQMQELPALRFAVFDFRLVSRLDSTALLSFSKLRQLAEQQGLTLVFTDLNPEIARQIAQGLLETAPAELVRIFRDLDHALEWCENAVLAADDALELPPPTLHEQLAQLVPATTNLDTLIGHLERRSAPAGAYLMRKGDAPDDMFFIESGQVTAQITQPNGTTLRLETMRGGHAVGELGFYLGRRRTADVVADEPSEIYRVTRAGLARIAAHDPAAAAAFHLILARLLSDRVVHLIETVDALQR